MAQRHPRPQRSWWPGLQGSPVSATTSATTSGARSGPAEG